MTARRAEHWDDRYRTIGSESVSWFTPEPTTSLSILDELDVGAGASLIDVGGGTSTLVDRLVERGVDVTVLDVSTEAIAEARTRVGDAATWIVADLLEWQPDRTWDVWHDRAVFHFLTDESDRAHYRELISTAVRPGGLVVVGTFAEDGPESCSGLPVRRYSTTQLHETVGPDFDLVASRRELHTTPANAVQSFAWVALRRGVRA